jgi:4-diphosphocytidyl-2-C-methyl-D-erythritol kinase
VLHGLPGCRLARMSGSGATCFGLFPTNAAAAAAARTLRVGYPQWWVRATVLGSRAVVGQPGARERPAARLRPTEPR